MKWRGTIAICLFLGFSFTFLEAAQRAIAVEPLPDNSILAYKGGGRQQHSNQKPQEPPKISDVTLSGTITAAQPNGLTINARKSSRSKDEKQWLVVSSGTTEVTVHGTATIDYLRRGQTVEFSGQVVNNEKIAGKVTELTITAYKGGSTHKGGAKADHAAEPGIGRIEAPKPAVAAGSDPNLNLGDDPKPDAGKAEKNNKPEAAAGPKAKIVARVASHDDKSVTVTSGDRTLHVDLSDSPTINVEMTNPKMVVSGSKIEIQGAGSNGHLVTVSAKDLTGAKIEVNGTAIESKLGKECVAKTMVITLATPLSGKKSTSSGSK